MSVVRYFETQGCLTQRGSGTSGRVLSSRPGVLQAPEFHRPPFDFLSFGQNGLPAAGVEIGRGEVFQALVIALRAGTLNRLSFGMV